MNKLATIGQIDSILDITTILINPFIPVSAKTATSQVDLQVWKG